MSDDPGWFDKLRYGIGRRSQESFDPNWPDWYRTYWSLNTTHAASGAPLSEQSIVVLDAETTGLDVNTDRLISVGALRVVGNSIRLGEKFEAYLPTPVDRSNTSAVLIHGIIPNSHRYTYHEEPALLKELLEYLGNAIIVGHHIGFDLEIINRSLRRQGAAPLRNLTYDTANIAKRLRPSGYWTPDGDYSLDALARRYRIPLSDRHTALGDCYITAVLWLKLLTRLAQKVGRDLTVSDL